MRTISFGFVKGDPRAAFGARPEIKPALKSIALWLISRSCVPLPPIRKKKKKLKFGFKAFMIKDRALQVLV